MAPKVRGRNGEDYRAHRTVQEKNGRNDARNGERKRRVEEPSTPEGQVEGPSALVDPVVSESPVVETPLERKREDKDPEEDAKRRRLPVEEKEKRSSESRKEDKKEGKKEKKVILKGGFDGRQDKRELGDAKGETTNKVPTYRQASDGWLELTNGEEEAGKQENRES